MILKTTSVYLIHKCTKCKEREPHNIRAATAGFVQLNFHCPPFGRNENLVIVCCFSSTQNEKLFHFRLAPITINTIPKRAKSPFDINSVSIFSFSNKNMSVPSVCLNLIVSPTLCVSLKPQPTFLSNSCPA